VIIENDEDAEGLVAWGFIKIVRGQLWDKDVRSEARDIVRWMTDNLFTKEERAVVRDSCLTGYEKQ
jgi:hypothetical protein